MVWCVSLFQGLSTYIKDGPFPGNYVTLTSGPGQKRMKVKGEQADLNPAQIDPSLVGRFRGRSESINQIKLAGKMELERDSR